jgi:hypothetical protein
MAFDQPTDRAEQRALFAGKDEIAPTTSGSVIADDSAHEIKCIVDRLVRFPAHVAGNFAILPVSLKIAAHLPQLEVSGGVVPSEFDLAGA